MAERYFEGQSSLPDLSEMESTEEKLEALLDYIRRMDEQYRYILCQLQEERD